MEAENNLFAKEEPSFSTSIPLPSAPASHFHPSARVARVVRPDRPTRRFEAVLRGQPKGLRRLVPPDAWTAAAHLGALRLARGDLFPHAGAAGVSRGQSGQEPETKARCLLHIP